METLAGKKIEKIYLSFDDEWLQFVTDKGLISFQAEGDCCSNSWVSDIINPEFLIGETVLSVEEISLDNVRIGSLSETDSEKHYEEEMQYYGYKIVTPKGVAEIIFRNSSNGYYGGWLAERERALLNASTKLIEENYPL